MIADILYCSKVGAVTSYLDSFLAFGARPLISSSPSVGEEQKLKTLSGRTHDDDELQDRSGFDDRYCR